MNTTLTNCVLVAVGGAAGALSRYGAVLLIKPHAPDFPLGTLTVNLVGCLLIGLLAGALNEHPLQRGNAAWTLLAVGVLGGFTTFSSFGIETCDLLNDKRYAAAAMYVLVSNLAGIALAIGGFWCGRMVRAGV